MLLYQLVPVPRASRPLHCGQCGPLSLHTSHLRLRRLRWSRQHRSAERTDRIQHVSGNKRIFRFAHNIYICNTFLCLSWSLFVRLFDCLLVLVSPSCCLSPSLSLSVFVSLFQPVFCSAPSLFSPSLRPSPSHCHCSMVKRQIICLSPQLHGIKAQLAVEDRMISTPKTCAHVDDGF